MRKSAPGCRIRNGGRTTFAAAGRAALRATL
jgi:hypothetical protein